MIKHIIERKLFLFILKKGFFLNLYKLLNCYIIISFDDLMIKTLYDNKIALI